LIEILFGNWISPNRLNRLNLIRNADLSYDVSHLYPSDHQVVYRRDRYGLRGWYKDPGSIDIMTVGGSTTDERYVSEGETWPDILRQDFLAEGKTVSVVNAGVDGQSTYGHIKNFDWWFPEIPRLKVGYFLFYIGINDFYKNANYKFDELFKGNISVKEKIKERSALYYLFRTLRGLYLAKVVEKADSRRIDFKNLSWTDTSLVSDHEGLMRADLAGYEERLRILGEKVRVWQAKPIFVTQSARSYKKAGGKILGVATTRSYKGATVNELDYYYMMQILNGKTLEVCRALEGICLDLANELELDEQDLYDFSHTAPQGSRKIGHYLYEKLKAYF